ncbi:hypothetical protein OE88DRAFT_1740272 [Heliocybe sulcata]|uniref:Fungal-type protein kinase domain-containing protein n=1 Tax=Heliocybe sulcata TaxID=5364 RepID=A0A5C3MJM7_9AGAM|nr:hypothetical protein OE88DRAFT_1740272 [Heliocybe sulcata]
MRDEVARTRNARDIVEIMYGGLLAHEQLHKVAGEIHGNIDLNTILCMPGDPKEDDIRPRGFLWDYEDACSYGLAQFPGFALNGFMSKLPKEMDINITDMMAGLAMLGQSE